MNPSPRRSRTVPTLAAGALAAALAFALVRPSAPDADDGGDPPLATTQDVKLYGAVERDGERRTVHIRAVNAARAARRCRVTATITEVRDSPMSRTVRMPMDLWSAKVRVAVEAGGSAEQQVVVPASIAARLRPSVGEVRHGVQLRAACLPDGPLG